MVLVTSNITKQLLCIFYIDVVRAKDFDDTHEDFLAQLSAMQPDFRVLADFSRIEKMDPECAIKLGNYMELLVKWKMGLLVRVIPSPDKDIGMNILTAFHYPRHSHIATCQTMTQAAQALEL